MSEQALSDPRPMAQPVSSSESAMVFQQFESLSNLPVSFKGLRRIIKFLGGISLDGLTRGVGIFGSGERPEESICQTRMTRQIERKKTARLVEDVPFNIRVSFVRLFPPQTSRYCLVIEAWR